MSEIKPDLTTALQPHFSRLQRRINTHWEAEVVSYDSATQLAKVQILVYEPDEGLPDDPIDVPVVFPGSATLRIGWGLAAGDPGYLFCHKLNPAGYRRTGQRCSAPGKRLHGMFCEFVPRRSTEASQWSDPVQEGEIAIGLVDGSVEIRINDAGEVTIKASTINLGTASPGDYVALASKVDDALAALKDFTNNLQTDYGTHTHTAAPGGGPTSPPIVPLVNPAPTLDPTGSEVVALD